MAPTTASVAGKASRTAFSILSAFLLLTATASSSPALDCLTCPAAFNAFEDVDNDGCFTGGTDIVVLPATLQNVFTAGAGNGLVVPDGFSLVIPAGNSPDWTADGICIAGNVTVSDGNMRLTATSGDIDLEERARVDVRSPGVAGTAVLDCPAPCGSIFVDLRARITADLDLELNGNFDLGERARLDADGAITLGDPLLTGLSTIGLSAKVKADGDIVVDHGGSLTVTDRARIDSRTGLVKLVLGAAETLNLNYKARVDADTDIDIDAGTVVTGDGVKLKTDDNIDVSAPLGITLAFKTRLDSRNMGAALTSSGGSIAMGERSRLKGDTAMTLSGATGVSMALASRIDTRTAPITITSTNGDITFATSTKVKGRGDVIITTTSTGSVVSDPSAYISGDGVMSITAADDVDLDSTTVRASDLTMTGGANVLLASCGLSPTGAPMTATFVAPTLCDFTLSSFGSYIIDDTGCGTVVGP